MTFYWLLKANNGRFEIARLATAPRANSFSAGIHNFLKNGDKWKMRSKKNRSQSGNRVCNAFLVVGTVVSLLGCSSMERSVTLGVGTGAAVGTGVGLIAGGHNKTETTLISAGVGALVGGITSYIIHGQLEKRDDSVRRNTLFNLENHGLTRTNSGRVDLSDVGGLLTMPEVQEDWVETHTEGNKMVEGHRVFTITDPSRWNLSQKPEKKKRK